MLKAKLKLPLAKVGCFKCSPPAQALPALAVPYERDVI